MLTIASNSLSRKISLNSFLPKEEIKKLERSILATIVYYDILDYPLTNFEVFLYLTNGDYGENTMGTGQRLVSTVDDKNDVQNDIENAADGGVGKSRYSLSAVAELLSGSEYLKEYIDQKLGFYFLHGREEIVDQRLDKKKIADQKWKKTRKIFRLMQVVPFLEGIFISGSLALGNSRKDSDIDLIVIAKNGRIWTTRTFVTILTFLVGARRHGAVTKDMICLNHYITDKSLKIPFESLYNAQSYIHLINLYDSGEDRKLFSKFQIENKWMGKYIKNYSLSEPGFRSVKRSRILSLISRIFESILSGPMGNALEKKLSELQSKRIKSDPLYRKVGGRITIGDDQLEFHPDSHEGYIIPEFNKRMKKLGLFEFANQKDSGLNK